MQKVPGMLPENVSYQSKWLDRAIAAEIVIDDQIRQQSPAFITFALLYRTDEVRVCVTPKCVKNESEKKALYPQEK